MEQNLENVQIVSLVQNLEYDGKKLNINNKKNLENSNIVMTSIQ